MIQVKDVYRSFGTQQVLKGVNLQVQHGHRGEERQR
jgi:ABC-type polar amino acid transport system ATPase subunit